MRIPARVFKTLNHETNQLITNMNLSQLAPYQVAMLIGGIVLFLLAVGLIVFCTSRKRSTKPALAILLPAIVMIGFPGIKSFEAFGFKVEVAVARVEKNAQALEEDPSDESARKELESALSELESNVSTETASANVAEAIAEGHLTLGNSDQAIQWADLAVAKAPNSPSARILLDRAKVSKALPKDTTQPLQPANVSNLTSAVTDLSRHSNLTPAARVTLARAQLALGQTNAATTNLQEATRLNPRLKLDPRLRGHLRPR